MPYFDLLDANALWYLPLGVVGITSWTVWIVRRTLSRRYRPIDNDHRTTTSVVVPVFRESPAILEGCLTSFLDQDPTEVILVIDVEDTELIALARGIDDPRIEIIVYKHQGKRSALGVGIRAARGEIVVLADSDTEWHPGLLASVQMPFVDQAVGGVGTRQIVMGRDTSVWRRVADWMVGVRYLDYVPAMARKGGVVCLSGRTAAYRRSVIMPLIPQLEEELFLGKRCVSGDDGRLTWLVLGSGYRTTYQSTAVACSMFPDSFRAFAKQRIRWSRNSYRCYLTAIQKGWLFKQPTVSQVTVLQILATPLSMFAAMLYVGIAVAQGQWPVVAIGVAWFFVGRMVRGISHLREHPGDIMIVPLVALSVAFVALPIKVIAFVTMNRQGWMTRSSDRIGGEGQADVPQVVARRVVPNA